MKIRDVASARAFGLAVEKRSGVGYRSVTNALAGRHDSQISTLQAIADQLDCPLWVLLLTNSKPEDLESPAREKLIAMVYAYLKCDEDGRHHVESMAAAFAASKAKK